MNRCNEKNRKQHFRDFGLIWPFVRTQLAVGFVVMVILAPIVQAADRTAEVGQGQREPTGEDTFVLDVESSDEAIVEVEKANEVGEGGYRWKCVGVGTVTITYTYLDGLAPGETPEEKTATIMIECTGANGKSTVGGYIVDATPTAGSSSLAVAAILVIAAIAVSARRGPYE